MQKVTKKQAEQFFREFILSEYSEDQKRDKYLVELDWAFFIDGLLKDKKITQSQFKNWKTPKF